MAILVPPAVIDVMQPVLDAPMTSDVPHELIRTYLVGRETGDAVAGFTANHGARSADLGVDPQDQLDAGESGRFTDVIDLFALEDPERAGVDLAFFFTLVFTSGDRSRASWKLA